MELLKINWFTGNMVIHLDTFFPNTIAKAKQLLKLVRQWCDDETKADLAEYFKKKILEIDAEIAKIKQIYPNTKVGSKEKKAVRNRVQTPSKVRKQICQIPCFSK